MKALISLLAGGLGLLLLLCLVGMVLPDSTHVERSIDVAAPKTHVFDTLNGFARFNEWSPWFETDPKAQYTLSGPATGIGAKQAWISQDLGSGSQEIIDIEGNELIKMRLDFGDQGKAEALYRLQALDEGHTRITWAFDSHAEGNLPARYFNLAMERLVGGDYEKGLAKLKRVLERPAP